MALLIILFLKHLGKTWLAVRGMERDSFAGGICQVVFMEGNL